VRAPSRDDLCSHLVASRICGDVATARESNTANARRCAAGEPAYTFGLQIEGWSYEAVVALMAERAGIAPDPAYVSGPDTIDAELCMDALERMRDRLALAARRRERVVLATGHPTGLLPVHVSVSLALQAAGCTVPDVAPGALWVGADGRQHHVRHIAGVAVSTNGVPLSGTELEHTHHPGGMHAMLAALEVAGEPVPDLVVADHGWAGAAGQAGLDVVAFADCNDPALFVAEAEGRVRVTVPLDDNVLPHLYEPVTRYLLAGIAGVGASGAVDGAVGAAGAGQWAEQPASWRANQLGS